MKMEKKIGEVFYYGDKNLKVVPDSNDDCKDCFFLHTHCEDESFNLLLGECVDKYRTDRTSVMFQEVSGNRHSRKHITFNFN